MHAEKISLFSPWHEFLNLSLPLFFILITLFGYFFGISVDATDRNYLNTFTTIFLLNNTHIIYTYILFLNNGKWKSWLSTELKEDRFFIFKNIFLFITLVLTFLYLMSTSNSENSVINNLGRKILMGLVLAINTRHTLGQCYGISLTYSAKTLAQSNDVDLKSKIIRLIKWQKIIYPIFMYSTIIGTTFSGVQKTFVLSFFVLKILLITSTLTCLGLIFLAYLENKIVRSNKIWYSLRYTLYLLAFLHPYAHFGVLAFHGIEYYFIYEKYNQETPINKNSAKNLLILFGFIVISFCVYENFGWFINQFTPVYQTSFLVLLAAVSRSMVYHHIYMDRQLFKFTNLNSKSNIIPTLLS